MAIPERRYQYQARGAPVDTQFVETPGVDKWFTTFDRLPPWRRVLPLAAAPWDFFVLDEAQRREALHSEALYPAFVPRLTVRRGRDPGWFDLATKETIPVPVVLVSTWFVEHQPNPRRVTMMRALYPERFLPQTVCFGFRDADSRTSKTWTDVGDTVPAWVDQAPSAVTWTRKDQPCP